MLQNSHSDHAPWFIVKADDKKRTRLNVIRHLLSVVDCPDKDKHLTKEDAGVVFPFSKEFKAKTTTKIATLLLFSPSKAGKISSGSWPATKKRLTR
ncbi:hypothetical protein VSX76_00015 (plasmid) [Methylophaga thalassica]|nr:hypothetical protein [Methylophaga thalassica]WVI83773.1 hypothetical protein VSX76_00015 [Methylophaga thalassica]